MPRKRSKATPRKRSKATPRRRSKATPRRRSKATPRRATRVQRRYTRPPVPQYTRPPVPQYTRPPVPQYTRPPVPQLSEYSGLPKLPRSSIDGNDKFYVQVANGYGYVHSPLFKQLISEYIKRFDILHGVFSYDITIEEKEYYFEMLNMMHCGFLINGMVRFDYERTYRHGSAASSGSCKKVGKPYWKSGIAIEGTYKEITRGYISGFMPDGLLGSFGITLMQHNLNNRYKVYAVKATYPGPILRAGMYKLSAVLKPTSSAVINMPEPIAIGRNYTEKSDGTTDSEINFIMPIEELKMTDVPSMFRGDSYEGTKKIADLLKQSSESGVDFYFVTIVDSQPCGGGQIFKDMEKVLIEATGNYHLPIW